MNQVKLLKDMSKHELIELLLKERQEHEEVIERIMALGSGPFGLMAAQLGATA